MSVIVTIGHKLLLLNYGNLFKIQSKIIILSLTRCQSLVTNISHVNVKSFQYLNKKDRPDYETWLIYTTLETYSR